MGAGPLVLERAQEVHNLPAGRREMLGGRRRDRAGHPVEALLQQAAQRPAGAVAGEHVEVMDVDIALAMGATGLGAEHLVEPVGRDHLACGVQHEAADAVALVRVGVHPPVRTFDVFADGRHRVEERRGRRGDGFRWLGQRAVGVGDAGQVETVGQRQVGSGVRYRGGTIDAGQIRSVGPGRAGSGRRCRGGTIGIGHIRSRRLKEVGPGRTGGLRRGHSCLL